MKFVCALFVCGAVLCDGAITKEFTAAAVTGTCPSIAECPTEDDKERTWEQMTTCLDAAESAFQECTMEGSIVVTGTADDVCIVQDESSSGIDVIRLPVFWHKALELIPTGSSMKITVSEAETTTTTSSSDTTTTTSSSDTTAPTESPITSSEVEESNPEERDLSECVLDAYPVSNEAADEQNECGLDTTADVVTTTTRTDKVFVVNSLDDVLSLTTVALKAKEAEKCAMTLDSFTYTLVAKLQTSTTTTTTTSTEGVSPLLAGFIGIVGLSVLA